MDEATTYLDEAIQTSEKAYEHDKNAVGWIERAARARFARSEAALKFGRGNGKDDLLKSISHWHRIENQLAAAISEWRLMVVEDRVPDRQLDGLNREHPQVRVEAIRLNEKHKSATFEGAISLREETTDSQWEELIQSARSIVFENRQSGE